MRPVAKIKTLFAQSNVTVGSEADSKMVNDALSAFDESMRTEMAVVQPSIWRIIMKSRITKLAAAEDKEQAIAAWEQWFESSGQIKFSPDAEILPVPETAEDADK
jgi:PIN domain nuclease of toxin-antitoxin system